MLPGTSSKYPDHTLFCMGYFINQAHAPARTFLYAMVSPWPMRSSSSNSMMGSTTFAEYGNIPVPPLRLPSRAKQRKGHGEFFSSPGVKFFAKALAQRI